MSCIFILLFCLCRGLTGAGSCLAFVPGEAGGCSQQAAGVKQAAAVLMRRERVGICGYGMVGGVVLCVHGGQAVPQRTAALHLHPLR